MRCNAPWFIVMAILLSSVASATPYINSSKINGDRRAWFNMKIIIYLVILISIANLCIATTPITQTVTTSPSDVYTNTTILIYSNSTDADNDSLLYEYLYYKNNVPFSSIDYKFGHLEIYQENANSTVFINSSPLTCSPYLNIIDGDWNTFCDITNNALSYLYQNYTIYPKSLKEDGLIQMYRRHPSSFVNQTIPTDCLISSPFKSRITFGGATYVLNFHCMNSTGSWITLDTYTGMYKFYEDTVIWITPNTTQGINNNIANLSSDNFVNGDIIIYSVRSFDGTNYSSWLNSSSITILNLIPSTPTGSSLNSADQVGESLEATGAGSTDADTDSITYYYEFRCNATDGLLLQTQSTDSSWVINTSCGRDSTAYVLIWAYDGSNFSASYETETKAIINSKPTTSGDINITPTSPTHLQNLTCNNESVYTDADTDSITLQYKWYLNDTFWNITTQILLSGNTSSNELWKCGVTPYDGYENGTEIFSATVSINTGNIAPIISSSNATTEGIISNSTYPTNLNETVNLSVQFTDVNTNESWKRYVCQSSGINSSGCLGLEWCNNSGYSTDKVRSCLIDDVSDLTFGSYTYYDYIIDNNSLISSASISSFYIGDDIVPVLDAVSVNSESLYDDQVLYMYANCSDNNNVSSVKFWLHTWFDDGATYNANITTAVPILNDNRYRGAKAVSTTGNWGLRAVYCLDQNGNTISWTDGINVTVSTRPTEDPGDGGGGGGTGFDPDDVEDLIASSIKSDGFIQFAYPGHTIKIKWFPTGNFTKEVIITAIDGTVNTTLNFSYSIRKYFKAEVCDLYTGECEGEINMLEGEQKYVRISGNLGHTDFEEYFLTEESIEGYVYTLQDNTNEGRYNLTIEKHYSFDKTLEWSEDMNDSWLMESKFMQDYIWEFIDFEGFTQKSMFYIAYSALTLVAGLFFLIVIRIR